MTAPDELIVDEQRHIRHSAHLGWSRAMLLRGGEEHLLYRACVQSLFQSSERKLCAVKFFISSREHRALPRDELLLATRAAERSSVDIPLKLKKPHHCIAARAEAAEALQCV